MAVVTSTIYQVYHGIRACVANSAGRQPIQRFIPRYHSCLAWTGLTPHLGKTILQRNPEEQL
jgi:hypothetical protein